MDGIGDVADDSYAQDAKSGKKRKYKSFKSTEISEKTQEPQWDYHCAHVLDIDEELIIKLQSESLAVAVYGMQDGREKFAKLKNAFSDNKDKAENNDADEKINEGNRILSGNSIANSNQSKPAAAGKFDDSELEKLRLENQKLMKMLAEKEKQTTQEVSKEGCSCVTCTIF